MLKVACAADRATTFLKMVRVRPGWHPQDCRALCTHTGDRDQREMATTSAHDEI